MRSASLPACFNVQDFCLSGTLALGTLAFMQSQHALQPSTGSVALQWAAIFMAGPPQPLRNLLAGVGVPSRTRHATMSRHPGASPRYALQLLACLARLPSKHGV